MIRPLSCGRTTAILGASRLHGSEGKMTIHSIRWLQGNDGESIAKELVHFIEGAKRTLHIAIYDFRLVEHEKKLVVNAIKKAAHGGVDVRIAYAHTRAT